MKPKSRLRSLSAIIGVAIVGMTWTTRAQSSQNPVQAENARPGTTAWQIANAENVPGQMEGYGSAASVNRGGQITFFVNTTDASYTLQVFRIGYYQGLGGRAETPPITLPGSTQTVPAPDPTTGIVDCNWTPAYTLTTNNPNDPTDWVSGAYVALLTGNVSGYQSYIYFVVRDDSRPSNLLYLSAVNTSVAYNAWGGKSLYQYNSTQGVAAVKVSFNRPHDDGEGTGKFMDYEWNMVAYLEQQGYDVTYSTDVDTETSPSQLLNHKGLLIVGHSEYWSWNMRQNLLAAINDGVNVGFFGANDIYWEIRYESSAVTSQPDRVIVCYKDLADAEDPMASDPSTYYLITDLWRNPKIGYPSLPEAQIIGEMYNGHEPMDVPVVVSNASNWVFNGSGLTNGSQMNGLQGYEADQIYPGVSPSNVIELAHSPYTISGSSYYSNMSLYQAGSGAWVFATGSMYFQDGLSNLSPWSPPSLVNTGAQQITVNVLNAFINSPSPNPSPTPTPTPAPTGPISLRGITVGGTSTTASSVSAGVPTGVQPGDVLIAQLAIRGGSGLKIVAPAGWSLIRRDNNGSAIAQALYNHVVPYWPAEPASYTWTFQAGNDAAAGIADYVGVSNATIVDVSGAQTNASSTNIVAPSVNIPAADPSDQLLYFFSIANSGGFLMPSGPTPEYGIVASGGGIGEGMSDLALTSAGTTYAATAAAYTASANVGAQVALIPGPPAPKPSVFLRSTATGSTATAASSVTSNIPAGVQPGDLMIAQIAVRGGSSQVITPPSGWNLVRSDYSGTSIVQAIYSHVVPSSPPEPASYTWSFKAGNNATAGIADFLGASGVSAVDITSGQGNASSTSISAPPLTISSASPSDHLVCLFATAGGITMTTPAGTTQEWSFPAASYGIGAAMSDIATVSPGTTATEVATGATAYANVGAQVALH